MIKTIAKAIITRMKGLKAIPRNTPIIGTFWIINKKNSDGREISVVGKNLSKWEKISLKVAGLFLIRLRVSTIAPPINGPAKIPILIIEMIVPIEMVKKKIPKLFRYKSILF